MRHRLKMVIPATMEAARLCTLAIKGICEGLGVEGEAVRATELATFEGLSNIVRHAYCFDPSRKIEVELEVDEDFCQVVLVDEGREFDLRRVPPPVFDHTDSEGLPEGGMGVHIIRQAVDEVDYRREGGKNYLRLRKYRAGKGPKA